MCIQTSDPDPVIVGSRIYRHLRQQSPATELNALSGSGVGPATAVLHVRELDWCDLDARSQDALVAFLQSEVPRMRANPWRYLPPQVPRNTDEFAVLVWNVRRMGDNDWEVRLLKQSEGGDWTACGPTIASGHGVPNQEKPMRRPLSQEDPAAPQ